MNKKLLALAIASLVSGGAFAQANVTISGSIYMGYDQNTTTGTAGTAGFGTVSRISDHSSNINIAGAEDLGGGMKAVFVIDSRFGMETTGGTWAGGNSHLGLTGNWGAVRMGKQDLHYSELASGLGEPRVRSTQSRLGHGMMSEVNGVAITPRTRANNVVWYTSPTMSGFTVSVAGSTAAFAAAEGGQAADGWNGTVKYANGPINAGYSYWQNNEEGGNGALASTAGSDQRSSRVWARYAFPMGLALGIGFDSSKYDNNVGTATNWVSRNAWLVTGQYTMGANAFYLQYAKAGNTSGTAAADTGSGAKAWMLAYDYALSKRTSIGISYTDLKNDATNGTYDFASTPVATPVGAKSSQLHLGMSHKF
jgi:predicted porin